jgi:predicted metalloprotease
MTTVGKLPQSWIGKWHHIAKFINNTVAPVIAASGVPITKASKASVGSMAESKAKATDAAQRAQEKLMWKKAAESVVTKFIFAENLEGASQEALLCLQKGNVKWGDWDTIDEAVSRIATNEKSRRGNDGTTAGRKLKIQVFFAEDDEMVGKGGQAYLEKCFAKADVTEYLDFHSEVVPATDHNEVLRTSKGATKKVMQEIGIASEEHAEPITLRALFDSPMTPGSETTSHSEHA